MNQHNFSEEDKIKVIDFLNMVAKHAKFEFNTENLIKYFKLLQTMQQVILPKINANILEVKSITEPEKDETPKKSKSKKSGA